MVNNRSKILNKTSVSGRSVFLNNNNIGFKNKIKLPYDINYNLFRTTFLWNQNNRFFNKLTNLIWGDSINWTSSLC